MSSPHDALFKAVLGMPEHARGALQSMMPAVLAEALDWTTLARRPGSFVDPALVERHTDLLFSTAWRGGGEALVYLLYEHQSTCDPRMPFRLLRYLVRIWEGWDAEHEGKGALPLIVPLVLYHGETPWSVPRTFDALLDVPAGIRLSIAPYLVQFTYLLDDLSDVPDERLRMRAMTALAKLVAVCFKHARTDNDLLARLAGWADTMREVLRTATGREALARVIRYIALVNDHARREDLAVFLERAVGPKAKDDIMATFGEQLIQEGVQQGFQQGHEQGHQQGLQQGIQQGERGLLLRLLRRRFGTQVDADIERRVAAASALQIERWSDRVLSAATLADVLAD